jgi:hypothetical protein
MSYTIGLYDGPIRQGEIELNTLFVMDPADYTCQPSGVVTNDEVCQIAKLLRREPDVRAGVIGKYDWRTEQVRTGFYSRA